MKEIEVSTYLVFFEVYQFDFAEIQALAKHCKRTMDFSVTLSGDTAYIATESGECEVNYISLQTK